MSKTLVVTEVIFDEKGRIADEIHKDLELSKKKGIVVHKRNLTWKTETTFDLTKDKVSVYKSDTQKESGIDNAVAGYVLMGAVGAMVGSSLSKGNAWVLEVEQENETRLFVFKNDMDKNAFKKFLSKVKGE